MPRRSESAEAGRRRARARRRGATTGATAVEFALVSPAFFILAIGIIQLGIAFHEGASVRRAVEQAARTAFIDPAATQQSVQAVVDQRLAALGDGLAVEIAFAVSSEGSVPVGRITGVYGRTVSVPMVPAFELSFPIDVSVPRY